ncbi:TRAP transporter small permease [Billgrantia diversa]|uniref:TRAP transporter small permease n=1 Tax=Halomonas sp. MCCC 1A13316 TaxID=2733487 RepID=UPI0018A41125|nr:TRAP transporter small permease [Halomonas sp. MCCC 1A13316]QOR37255.1 TRAP transporter small permease [Halomonas sp. MCCC 1A13316]
MKIIDKAIDRVVYGMFLCGVIVGILMTLTVFVSTLMRYLFNTPLHFSNELAGLLFLSITFLTIPHVLNIDRHIGIDLVVKQLPVRFQGFTGQLAGLVLLVFAVIFVYQSWDFMVFSRAIDARSDISGLLLWPWMLVMPLSFTMCCIITLKKTLVRFFARDRKPFYKEASS